MPPNSERASAQTKTLRAFPSETSAKRDLLSTSLTKGTSGGRTLPRQRGKPSSSRASREEKARRARSSGWHGLSAVVKRPVQPPKGALIGIVKHLGAPCFTVIGTTTSYFFRIEAGFPPVAEIPLPPGIVVLGEGATIALPTGEDLVPERFRALSASDLPLLGRGHAWYHLHRPELMPAVENTPLTEPDR